MPTTRPGVDVTLADATPAMTSYHAPPVATELLRPVASSAAPTESIATVNSYVAPRFATGNAQTHARTLRMMVTAYCPCAKCCGPNARGVTASGRSVSYNGGRFVAADTSVHPFGTRLQIPGYGADLPVEVIDRGGAIKGNRLDVYFPTHEQAIEWGRQWVNVTVVE